MSLPEAMALHKLLGLLPNTLNDARIDADEFTEADWKCLMDMYKAYDAELREAV